MGKQGSIGGVRFVSYERSVGEFVIGGGGIAGRLSKKIKFVKCIVRCHGGSERDKLQARPRGEAVASMGNT